MADRDEIIVLPNTLLDSVWQMKYVVMIRWSFTLRWIKWKS